MAQYELNLRDYVRILRKRRTVLIVTTLTILLVSWFYVSRQPVVYEAVTTVKILERQNIAGMLTEWIVYTPADLMESQAKMIKGFPIVKETALRMGMVSEKDPVSKVNLIVSGLQGRINTETIEKTNIIKITVSSSSAKEAMDLANILAETYVDENLLEKKKQASGARQFIEEQLGQLETRLKDGEEQLKNFSEVIKNIKLAEPIQQELVKLEFELSSLLQKYTEKHPRVVQIRDQIRELEEQLKGFSGQELEYARVVREVEVNKKLYFMLKEKLEEARITEAQKVGDVSIVDPAVMPQFPVDANKKLAVVIGGVMGLILGMGLAFLFETLDTSIGTIEDVENLIKLPILGIIPPITVGSEEVKEEKKGVLAKFKRRFFPHVKSEGEEEYVHSFVQHQPSSSIAEAYRNLRTNLKLDSLRKTILVTSSGAREGKSSIVINLCLSLAQKGMKTLLVSTDLRRPIIAKVFGFNKIPGLNELMTKTVILDEALRNISDIMLGNLSLDEIMKAPGIENLWILPSGQLPFNPAEILESDKFMNLMGEFRKRFDVIILDSPPALPITDASLLAPKVDGVVLCYEVGRTAKDALVRTKVQLESSGAKILGIVLNHIASQTETISPYPYYYKYQYKYYKDEDKKRKDAE